MVQAEQCSPELGFDEQGCREIAGRNEKWTFSKIVTSVEFPSGCHLKFSTNTVNFNTRSNGKTRGDRKSICKPGLLICM